MITDARVLFTGARGTVGRALGRQLLGNDRNPAEVIGLDNNERELFFPAQKISA